MDKVENQVNQYVNTPRDYVQSANSLFHFMQEKRYLIEILEQGYLSPRYCKEDISFLNLEMDGQYVSKINVLQKCFCEMQLHQLREIIQIKASPEIEAEEKTELERMTHPGFYGRYAVAFSKRWGIQKGLQTVYYLNRESEISKWFSAVFSKAIALESMPDELYNDIIVRLSFIKGIIGKTQHTFETKRKIEVGKNFSDEREWRFVPEIEAVRAYNIKTIIPETSKAFTEGQQISDELKDSKYNQIHLRFDYDDIKYIIVPDEQARIEIIEDICKMSKTIFVHDDEESKKMRLISKILVLQEGMEDW